MNLIKLRKIFFAISGTLALMSILVWIAWGLNYGIDFTGGSLLEIDYLDNRPDRTQIMADLASLNLEGLNVQSTGDNGFILRFKTIDEQTHQNILNILNGREVQSVSETNAAEADSVDSVVDAVVTDNSAVQITDITTEPVPAEADKVVEKRFEAIGPAVGQELKTKSLYAIIIVLIAIILYVAWAFRKVSYPVNSWKYGTVAIIALFHDILITVGIFILLGRYLNFEVNTPFVAALLTILGYSVNDTIVIFDRIRENLHKYEGDFEEIVNKSILETISRSVNTAFTTELVLVAIFVFGGASIRDFVFALLVGIFLGTYSSIFIASPLLVVWQKLDWKFKKS